MLHQADKLNPTALRSCARPLLRIGFAIGMASTAAAQTSYRGFYSGSLSTGAHVGVYAETNSEAAVVVIDPASGSFGATNSVAITSTGQLTCNYSIATITGQISPNGAVTGTVAPLGFALAAQRAPTNGSTASLAGFYQGWDFDPNNVMLTVGVMVSADGQFFIYVENGPNVTDAGYGSINSQGIFSFSDAKGNVSSGSIITTAGGVGWNGRYTKPGVGGFTFVAARRDSANQLINLSTRAQVGSGGNALTAGFVVSGGAKTLLIRGVGPTLANYGVTTGYLANPQLSVFSGSVPIAANTGWSSNSNAADIVNASAQVGAFALPSGSADSVLLLRLEPGDYTAQVSGVGGTSGTALVEVYQVE